MKHLAPVALALTALVIDSAAAPASSAEEAKPLGVDASVPDVAVKDSGGADLNLREAVAGTNTVLVFYRGGWCVYCNKHLAALQAITPRLREQGYNLFAISPDPVEELEPTAEKDGVDFTLLSDHDFKAVEAFGLTFALNEEPREAYAGYGIPLYSPPGSEEKVLPVPAVYVINGEGRIVFAHWDPDYKVRLDPADLLKVIEKP